MLEIYFLNNKNNVSLVSLFNMQISKSKLKFEIIF